MKFPSFCDKFNMPHGSLKTKARFFATVQNDTSGVIAFSFQVLLKNPLIKPCTPRHCPCYEQPRAERLVEKVFEVDDPGDGGEDEDRVADVHPDGEDARLFSPPGRRHFIGLWSWGWAFDGLLRHGIRIPDPARP